MFTMCPNCHRIYDVPADKIKPGKQVFHCAACDYTFEQTTQSEEEPDITQSALAENLTPDTLTVNQNQLDEQERTEATTVFDEEPRPDFTEKVPSFLTDNPLSEPLSETPDAFMPIEETPKKKKYFLLLTIVTLIFFMILSLLTTSRFYLVRRFPQTQSFYRVLGLETEPLGTGLDFQDTFFDVMKEDEVPTLLVKGTIVNISNSDKKMPFIHLILTDKNGKTTGEQTLAPVKEIVSPGEVLPFETKIKPMNLQTRRIDITFKKAESS